jgi:hypothetical protein
MNPIKIDLTTNKKLKTIKVWINVYKDGFVYGYPSSREAVAVAMGGMTVAAEPVTIALPLEITYEEK